MNPEAPVHEFHRLVTRELGLWFDEPRHEPLVAALSERASARGCSPEDYLHFFAAGRWPDENRVLARRLTVPETYFFRGNEHFQALADAVLPEQQARPPELRRLRLLSAGCASGEEAYTLAIMLRERAPWLEPAQVEIVAIDINTDMLARGRAGRYTAWSLRETPAWARERYFQQVGQEYQLSEEICRAVTFQERNLSIPDAGFWRAGRFDAVFCRNVLMYFASDKAAAIVGWIAESLAPGGHLFLGHAETLRGLSQAFQLRHRDDAFFYQLRTGPQVVESPSRSPFRPPEAPAPLLQAPLDSSWFDEIGRASARIASLSSATATVAAVAAIPAPERKNEIESVLDLHRQERFTDALARMQQLPAAPADADRQMLQAILLVNCGRLAEAETLSSRLLANDDLNAGAHYLTALCREHAGDPVAAEEHDRAASYLDATFAMPRFHLGLLCKQQGRTPEAKAFFAEALGLLKKEDSVRLTMFGGGFARDALVELCRAELQWKGGRP